jgi:hypothetical protein
MADSQDPASEGDSNSPDDNQFNRITLSSLLKTQLMQDIAESTDSLPTWRQRLDGIDGFESEDENAASGDATAATAKEHAATADAKQVQPPRDDPLVGADLTTVKTVTQADEDADSGKKARPGALRRLTTRIRKTISGQPVKEGKTPT